MRLSMSNLAWNTEDSQNVYEYLCRKNFTGIEIAPTKLFPESPYTKTDDAISYFDDLKTNYNIEVSSIQSMWYGQTGNIFNSVQERLFLQNYTFLAVDFASKIRCKNLVFGNPKARNKGDNHKKNEVFDFFRTISDYAHKQDTCIALEPNPTIYGTDFINTTKQAFDFCRESGCKHLRVNIDLGTIIYNNEPFNIIEKNLDLVNHIHISEPYLKKIKKRDIHKKLKNLDFDKYVSVEMGLQNRLSDVFEVIDYISEVFE